VHVGQLVASLVDGQHAYVGNVGHLRDHRASVSPHVHGVDHDQQIYSTHQLLDEMDAAYSHLEHTHSARQLLGEEPLCNCRSETIIAAEHVSKTGNEDIHGARVGGRATT